ncbi:hypothetical protein AAG614_09700 [Citromicrobium bathyomarinum]
MRIAVFAIALGLSLSCAAMAANITQSQAVKAYEAGKAGQAPRNGYDYASCAGAWAGWTKHALENYKDPLVAALPDDMKSSGALKKQLYWQEKAMAEVKAGRIEGTQAQAMLTTGKALVDTSLAEATASAMTRMFGELGRCHAQQ